MDTKQIKQAAEAAEYFLCGSQQSPIRINEKEFEQLFDETPERFFGRWAIVKQRLQNTRRQYTFSLVAQTSFAVIAWILTVIGSYATALGQHSEALLLSSGTLWTWLIPVVLGWMTVGVQSRKDTIQNAIEGESSDMKAFEAGPGMSIKAMPKALLGKVPGDETLQGPAYNYARMLTYPKLRKRVVEKFEDKLGNLAPLTGNAPVQEPTADISQVGLPIHEQDSARSSTFDLASATSQPSLVGFRKPGNRKDTNQVEAQTSSSNGPYMTWQDVKSTPDWVRSFLLSNIVAVILQWGVTGSAIVISYLTEVRGLGCRSGSYLLYGILATSAHVLLVCSVFLSNGAMLTYQYKPKPEPKPESKPESNLESRTALRRRILCTLAVATRYLGKTLAVANALWIILSSIFELIGFYESCYCTGTQLGLGDRAWVVLFASGDKMRDEAEPSWIGGLAMSLLTMLGMYFVTRWYSWGRKKRAN